MASVPSVDQYERAFRSFRIADALPETHRKLLQLHYCSAGRTATATELAAGMKFKDYSAVNLHYGTFGANLAARLKWHVPEGEPAASSFATFEGGPADDPHTKWIMRPEVAQVIEKLRIVRPCPEV